MQAVAGSSNYEKFTSAMVAACRRTPSDQCLPHHGSGRQWTDPAHGPVVQAVGHQVGRIFPWIWAMQHHHGKLWCLVQEATPISSSERRCWGCPGWTPTSRDAVTTLKSMPAPAAHRPGQEHREAGFIPWFGPAPPSVDRQPRRVDHGCQGEQWTLNTYDAALDLVPAIRARFSTNDAANQLTSQFTGKITALGWARSACRCRGLDPGGELPQGLPGAQVRGGQVPAHRAWRRAPTPSSVQTPSAAGGREAP
jgi:hypothetical protein